MLARSLALSLSPSANTYRKSKPIRAVFPFPRARVDLFSSLSLSFSTFALDHLNFRPGEREKLAAYFLKALCPPLKRAPPIKISDRDASESRRSFCSANFAPAENGKKRNVEKGTHKKEKREKERTGTSLRLDERDGNQEGEGGFSFCPLTGKIARGLMVIRCLRVHSRHRVDQ